MTAAAEIFAMEEPGVGAPWSVDSLFEAAHEQAAGGPAGDDAMDITDVDHHDAGIQAALTSAPEALRVVCNSNPGLYLVTRRAVECHCDTCSYIRKDPRCPEWLVSPTEYERHSGMPTAKKWRYSIKVCHAGEPATSLGRWLELRGLAQKIPKKPKITPRVMIPHQDAPASGAAVAAPEAAAAAAAGEGAEEGAHQAAARAALVPSAQSAFSALSPSRHHYQQQQSLKEESPRDAAQQQQQQQQQQWAAAPGSGRDVSSAAAAGKRGSADGGGYVPPAMDHPGMRMVGAAGSGPQGGMGGLPPMHRHPGADAPVPSTQWPQQPQQQPHQAAALAAATTVNVINAAAYNPVPPSTAAAVAEQGLLHGLRAVGLGPAPAGVAAGGPNNHPRRGPVDQELLMQHPHHQQQQQQQQRMLSPRFGGGALPGGPYAGRPDAAAVQAAVNEALALRTGPNGLTCAGARLVPPGDAAGRAPAWANLSASAGMHGMGMGMAPSGMDYRDGAAGAAGGGGGRGLVPPMQPAVAAASSAAAVASLRRLGPGSAAAAAAAVAAAGGARGYAGGEGYNWGRSPRDNAAWAAARSGQLPRPAVSPGSMSGHHNSNHVLSHRPVTHTEQQQQQQDLGGRRGVFSPDVVGHRGGCDNDTPAPLTHPAKDTQEDQHGPKHGAAGALQRAASGGDASKLLAAVEQSGMADGVVQLTRTPSGKLLALPAGAATAAAPLGAGGSSAAAAAGGSSGPGKDTGRAYLGPLGHFKTGGSQHQDLATPKDQAWQACHSWGSGDLANMAPGNLQHSAEPPSLHGRPSPSGAAQLPPAPRLGPHSMTPAAAAAAALAPGGSAGRSSSGRPHSTFSPPAASAAPGASQGHRHLQVVTGPSPQPGPPAASAASAGPQGRKATSYSPGPATLAAREAEAAAAAAVASVQLQSTAGAATAAAAAGGSVLPPGGLRVTPVVVEFEPQPDDSQWLKSPGSRRTPRVPPGMLGAAGASGAAAGGGVGPDGRKVDAQGDTVMQEGEGEEGGISVGEDFQAELPQYRGPKLELHEVHLPTQRAELAKMGHPGPTEAEVCAEVVREKASSDQLPRDAVEDVWEKRTPGLALERGQRVRKAPGWLKPEQYIDPLQPYSLVGGPPPPKGRGSEEEGGEEDPASDPGRRGFMGNRKRFYNNVVEDSDRDSDRGSDPSSRVRRPPPGHLQQQAPYAPGGYGEQQGPSKRPRSGLCHATRGGGDYTVGGVGAGADPCSGVGPPVIVSWRLGPQGLMLEMQLQGRTFSGLLPGGRTTPQHTQQGGSWRHGVEVVTPPPPEEAYEVVDGQIVPPKGMKCVLCHKREETWVKVQEGANVMCSDGLGALVPVDLTAANGDATLVWVHRQCALWSAEVVADEEGQMHNAPDAVRRGRATKCSCCGEKGATVSCFVRGCVSFHLPCARDRGCKLLDNPYVVLCPRHRQVPLEDLGIPLGDDQQQQQQQEEAEQPTEGGSSKAPSSDAGAVAAEVSAELHQQQQEEDQAAGTGSGDAAAATAAAPASGDSTAEEEEVAAALFQMHEGDAAPAGLEAGDGGSRGCSPPEDEEDGNNSQVSGEDWQYWQDGSNGGQPRPHGKGGKAARRSGSAAAAGGAAAAAGPGSGSRPSSAGSMYKRPLPPHHPAVTGIINNTAYSRGSYEGDDVWEPVGVPEPAEPKQPRPRHTSNSNKVPLDPEEAAAEAEMLAAEARAEYGLDADGNIRLGGTTGQPGRAGRCSVCVVQRKGKCGTDSAPKKCLRRIAKQQAQAAAKKARQAEAAAPPAQ